MCKELKFKPITADQIEVKPTDTKNKNSCVLLLYISSRSAADILNTTVGVYNWQITYKDVAGQIYGALSIYDEERNIWVTKEDTGEESNISEKKGQASDILKRCIARWGCDWLYHTPRIRIQTPQDYWYNERMTMTFTVKEISFDEETKDCTSLVIVDKFGKVVYDMNNSASNMPSQKTEQSIDNLSALKAFCTAQKAVDGTNKDELLRFFKFYEPKCAEWSKYKVDWASKWDKWHTDAKKPIAA